MLADGEINGLIILMHNLGCDFDNDPQYPWARFKIFPDKTYEEKEPDSFLNLQKVYDQFLKFHEHTVGEEGAYLKAAHQRLRDKRLEDFKPFTDDNIVRSLRTIYPQRCVETPDVPCSIYFEEAEWKALTTFITKQPISADKPPTLREAIRMVAALGGFLARKCDGEPGTQTIWLGLQRLDDLTEMLKVMTVIFRHPPSASHISGVQQKYG
jgi:hypothetical protein